MDWNLTRYRLGTVLRVVLGGVWAWTLHPPDLCPACGRGELPLLPAAELN